MISFAADWPMLTEKQTSEADRLSKYLVGSAAPQAARQAYWKAVERLGCEMNGAESRAWERMMRSSFLLRCVDAGLALLRPASLLRKRVFIMLAVLETEPGLADHFLPQDRPRFFLIRVTLRMVRAVSCAVIGVCLVKMWRLA
jgi:hypothetical protein